MPITDDPWVPADYLLYGNNLPPHDVRVYRYHTGGEEPYEWLPSLECLEVQYFLGSRPPVARFRYRFGDGNAFSPPTWESALSADYAGIYPQGVNPGDRLVVVVTQALPPGSLGTPFRTILFDGHPYGFEGAIADGTEECHLVCIGIPKRFADKPVVASWWRHSDDVENNDANVRLLIPAAFNEGGKWNATPDTAGTDRVVDDDLRYRHPCFLDPLSLDEPSAWTLERAVAYLLYADPDPTLVDYEITLPTRFELDELLVAQKPIDGVDYDPNDSATFTAEPIAIPITPIFGRRIAPTVEALVGDKGFWLRWELHTNTFDLGFPKPVWELKLARAQAGATKDLYLQPRYTPLDLAYTNAASISFARDLSAAFNTFVVRGARTRYEGGFVLECGFESSASDVNNVENYSRANEPDFSLNYRDAYRLFLFGEDKGSLIWAPNGGAIITDITSLDDVLGADNYVHRPRPALGELCNRDAAYRPLKPKLYWSNDYTGPAPAVWDGSGTWHEINGGYQILKERLGVWVSCPNPSDWHVGDDADGNPVVLNVVESMADGTADTADPPTAPDFKFRLMLHCSIEGDDCVNGVSERDYAAALPETVIQVVDAGDRYRRLVITPSSYYAQNGPVFGVDPGDLPLTEPHDVVDDTELAEAEALSYRQASQGGVLDGPVAIGYFTTYYAVGDRVKSINGRGLNLRTDGDPTSKAPIYPIVTSVRYVLRGPQFVQLELSDSVTHRLSYRHRGKPRPTAQAHPTGR